MKSWCCLIVFESLLNSTVDDNLVILKFPTNHSEGRVQEMVVNVNLFYQRVSKTVEFGSNVSKVFIYNNGFFFTYLGEMIYIFKGFFILVKKPVR